MTSPRTLMIAGVVLIAVALGSTGHGFWWLFGLLWVLPHSGRAGACHGVGSARRRRDHLADGRVEAPATPVGPDPTTDRHEAFRSR